MHLSENEGIEGVRFAVTGGQGFVGAALCLELLRRGAQEVRSLDLRASSSWSQQLLDAGVRLFQGRPLSQVTMGLLQYSCAPNAVQLMW
jgi:nucleoside-diphosphate-sugar epimerase